MVVGLKVSTIMTPPAPAAVGQELGALVGGVKEGE